MRTAERMHRDHHASELLPSERGCWGGCLVLLLPWAIAQVTAICWRRPGSRRCADPPCLWLPPALTASSDGVALCLWAAAVRPRRCASTRGLMGALEGEGAWREDAKVWVDVPLHAHAPVRSRVGARACVCARARVCMLVCVCARSRVSQYRWDDRSPCDAGGRRTQRGCGAQRQGIQWQGMQWQTAMGGVFWALTQHPKATQKIKGARP